MYHMVWTVQYGPFSSKIYWINHELSLHMFFPLWVLSWLRVYFWGEEKFLLSQKTKMFNFSLKYHIKWLIINESLNLHYIPFKIEATKIFIWHQKLVSSSNWDRKGNQKFNPKITFWSKIGPFQDSS